MAHYEILFPRQEALPLRTEALFGDVAGPARRGPLADLNPGDEHYELEAATRIAEIEDLADVEAYLAAVENRFKKTVITLAVNGLALRIAKLPLLPERQAALEKLAPDIRDMVRPHVKRLYETKPWERKARG